MQCGLLIRLVVTSAEGLLQVLTRGWLLQRIDRDRLEVSVVYLYKIVDRPTRDILTIRKTTKSEWSDMPVNISPAG